jgi:dTDP-4-amino-4,6-dideoxygalactose transaminase
MIPVTKPFSPPIAEYQNLLQGIWQRNWLTNNGPLVNELELRLKEYLGIKHLLFTANGTIALQLAIKALGITGEIITTPFSYVATTSSIVWQGCVPVFADIDPVRLSIDPQLIEPLITGNTKAILSTHVYGIPSYISEIDDIASRHNLKVIYDGAHAFGTTYENHSLLSYGDISIVSTHATKIFHTVEGGVLIARDPEALKRLAYMRNFGHDGPEQFNGVGINGKNSEFHAAMGLVNLKYFDEIVQKREEQVEYYKLKLKNFEGSFIAIPENTIYNYAYFPILFESEDQLKKAVALLERNKIFGRRYFFPLLNSLDYVANKNHTPVADDISRRIFCLPLYYDLSFEEIDLICRLILRSQNY